MATISESEFLAQLKARDFRRAYFIFGEEKYLVDHYTRQLVEKVLQGNGNAFNLQAFSSPDLDIDALNDAVEALPLMAPLKCVKITDLDVEKEPQDTIKKLKELLSDVPDTTVLVISQSGLSVDLKKAAKWSSFVKFFEKHGEVLNLPLMSNAKLKKQLIKWAEKLSCVLSERAAQNIIDRCGSNLLTLKQELEKLCAYVGGGEISQEAIEAVVVEDVEANIFELTKALMAKNYRRAFELLEILLDKKEEPTAILAIMASSYIDLYRVKAAEQSGKTIYDVAEVFDYKRKMFRLENAQRYARNLSMEYIRTCINLLAETDAKLKSTRLEPRFLLEELITKISSL